MLIAALIVSLGSGIMLAANGSRGLAPIFAGRAIAGFGIGQASSMAPLYISEIAPPQIRGQLIGMYEIAWQIGGIIGVSNPILSFKCRVAAEYCVQFWINYGVSLNLPSGFSQWFTPFAVQLIPSCLFAIMIPLVVRESPRWLIQRGKRDRAIANLCYLRKLDPSHPYLIEEVNAITLQVETDVASIVRLEQPCHRLSNKLTIITFRAAVSWLPLRLSSRTGACPADCY